jgi:hypothetical protein
LSIVGPSSNRQAGGHHRGFGFGHLVCGGFTLGQDLLELVVQCGIPEGCDRQGKLPESGNVNLVVCGAVGV